jgi:thiamine biosynthesis lipoprotein
MRISFNRGLAKTPTTCGVALLTLATVLVPRHVWPVERAELVMGAVARITISDPGVTPDAFEMAFAALRAVDATMSLYREESELVRVNAHAAAHPEPVGAELFALLVRARELSSETDGAFDVTVLPLLRLWGAYPELTYLGPGRRAAVGFAALQLDPQARTVSFRRQGMGLDLGGIAKGFALDRARAALAAAGVQCARLDLGGNLAFFGSGPGGKWDAAVRDPDNPDTPLGVLSLEADSTLSTSANYARDFVADGWLASSHVYDPRSGRPVLRPLAVTAWAADAVTADALSTALLVLGPEGAPAALEHEPQAGALFVDGRGPTRRVTIQGRAPRAWIEKGAAIRDRAQGPATARLVVDDAPDSRIPSGGQCSRPRQSHTETCIGVRTSQLR